MFGVSVEDICGGFYKGFPTSVPQRRQGFCLVDEPEVAAVAVRRYGEDEAVRGVGDPGAPLTVSLDGDTHGRTAAGVARFHV